MSKSLEALERLTKGNASNSDITLIKRELKAIEILRNAPSKAPNNLKGCLRYIIACLFNSNHISQEEYKLLKKVLK